MSAFLVEPEVMWKLATPAEVKSWADKGLILGTSLDIQDGYMLAADATAVKEQASLLYRGIEVELLCIQPTALPEGTKWMCDEFEDTLLSQCLRSECGAPAYVRRLSSGTIHVHLRKQLPWSAVSHHYSLPVRADGVHHFPIECSEHTKSKSATSMVEVIILGTGTGKSNVYYGESCTSFAVLVDGQAVLLCDVGAGVVHAAMKELGWNGLPNVIIVSHSRDDNAADLPVLLAVEALERGRHMKVVALPDCMHQLKTVRMQEMMKTKMRPLRDFAEWLQVAGGDVLEVDSGTESQKIILEPYCSDSAHFAGFLITVGGVSISWTADCLLDKGNYAIYENLALYAQLFVAHAMREEKNCIAPRHRARFEDVVNFVHYCSHASFLSEEEGSLQQPVSKHGLIDKMEMLKKNIGVKERERSALMAIIGTCFETLQNTEVESTAASEQPILLLTGMLMRLKAEERMMHEVNAALSKSQFERDDRDRAIIDSCERFLHTKVEELDNAIKELREKQLSVSALASLRNEEENQICSVVVTGYGSKCDAPTHSTGIPRSAVLAPGQRVFLSRMQQQEVEASMKCRRMTMSTDSLPGKSSPRHSTDAPEPELDMKLLGTVDDPEDRIATAPGLEGLALRTASKNSATESLAEMIYLPS